MARSGLKIAGLFVLLGGLASAVPQAQIRAGVSAKGADVTSAPAKAANNSQQQQPAALKSSGNRRQKPAPAIIEPPAQAIVPVVQQAPVVQVPLHPEQMPPVPPKVSYQNGLLSVEATNSTLGDILNSIRTKAGIQIDGLQGATDRVAAKLGPAPADTVLTALLRGSRYDYLILGRPEQPEIVQRLILNPAEGFGSAPSSNAGVQPLQPRPGMILVQPVEDDEVSSEEQPQPAPQFQQPQQTQPVVQSGNGQLQNNGPKTTEQLLEELKQMQQQQNQPNQQQNVQPPPPLKPRIPQ